MLYAIKNTDDLEKLEKLASLESQVKAVRIQDSLGKQNFHEDMKEAYEIASQDITKTITETS